MNLELPSSEEVSVSAPSRYGAVAGLQGEGNNNSATQRGSRHRPTERSRASVSRNDSKIKKENLGHNLSWLQRQDLLRSKNNPKQKQVKMAENKSDIG